MSAKKAKTAKVAKKAKASKTKVKAKKPQSAEAQFKKGKHGVFAGISEEVYRKFPALSSTEARILNTDVPYRIIANREYPKTSDSMEFGRIMHSLLLEGQQATAQQVEIFEGTFNSKDARERRDEAIANGKLVMRARDWDVACAMLEAQKSDDWGIRFFVKGRPEVVVRWKCPKIKAECKVKFDWFPEGYNIFADYKTAGDISDSALTYAIKRYKYFQQMAHYLEGAESIFGTDYELQAVLLFQEKEAPYLCRVIQLTPAQIELGQDLNWEAKRIYAECTKNNYWPSYEPSALELGQRYTESLKITQ